MGKITRRTREVKKKERQPIVKVKLGYPIIPQVEEGEVIDIVHERSRGAPVAIISFKEHDSMVPASEGIYTGKKILIGDNAPVDVGNITKIKNVPEGMAVNSVETTYGSGGSISMVNGSYSLVVNHRKETNETVIKIPSGKKITVSSECRCIVGVVAGGGIHDKPLLKASVAHYKAKARGHVFPRVRGVAMNPVEHLHGGGNHQHIGKPSTVSKKDISQEQKIGLVGARRTGYRVGSRKV
ncbi:60S ribosomal protein L8 [Encephalitozoon intestinalis ATCC 50506]|uniref:60S ribosomal protein L8 n=1 Tax=Encephalitozoon intestinalis (strain ATCC 50506) TaxID=876142 RepID=E0S596_ENCIT|nr:60S ribosomal protein L8 [Encephalitozoon intestinalis ATCC 50506]ADM10881.1 60S ribosomal protein L8 [Encephalitozoon intestinalis ATCC 50506]UTX44513.1 ribosomal protein L8 [Encephalitozoon intestinalis]